MARKQPALIHHKGSGQGVVRINGKSHYCGKYGTKACKAEYDRLIREWKARQKGALVTVGQLILAWDEHATDYYTGYDGRTTTEVAVFKAALWPLGKHFSARLVSDFTPADLKRCRQCHVDRDISRGVANKYTSKIVQVFKWAVAEGLCPVETWQALTTVPGLRQGRSAAREADGVHPVDLADVRAVYDHVSRQVRAMIDLQLLSGCRPGEIVQLRPCDLEEHGDCLAFRPGTHKNQHRGKSRVIVFGPRAVKILRPFLDDRPAESRLFPDYGTTAAYRRHIERACKRAGIEKWSPNQLRHTRLTDLRKLFGVEAASHIAGHAKISMTEHYAEKSLGEAVKVMAEVG